MISEVKSLRAVLCLIVFFFHSGLYPNSGAMAVSCFFVLGGFCSSLAYLHRVTENNFDYKKYLKKRLIKYYLVHWLYLVVNIILFQKKIYLIPFLLNVLLLQSWIPFESCYFSYNIVSWYLSDAVFFVWVMPFFLRWLADKSKILLFRVLLILLLVYCLFSLFVPEDMRQPILYVNPLVRLVDYLIGLIGGLLFIKYKNEGFFNTVPIWIYKNIVLLSFSVLFILPFFLQGPLQWYSCFYWPSSFLLIVGLVAGAGRLQKNNVCILSLLGDISFSFYMLHLQLLHYIGPLLVTIGITSKIGAVLIILVITVLFSYFFTFYVEKPAVTFFKHVLQ